MANLYDEYIQREHLYNLKTRGFSIFPDYLPIESCDNLKSKLVTALDNYSSTGNERSKLDKEHLHDLICQDISFAKLLEDTRLQQLISPLLGEYWVMYAFTSSSAPPHGTNYGGRIHVDSPRWIADYPTNIGVIWAIDDFTASNGGTWLIPASHHSPEIPSEEYFNDYAIQLECKQGALIIFDARVVHRTGVNNTSTWRHALTMNVCRSYMKQRMDWVRFVPENISSRLNEQARRILGFDTRLPTSLEEFFVPEDKRLYKSGQG